MSVTPLFYRVRGDDAPQRAPARPDRKASAMPEQSSDPLTLVTTFCAAWARLNVDEIVGYFADDAVYHNIPLDPVTGRDDIRTFIEGFTGGVDSVDFEVRHAVADGNLVMTERVDHFHTGDKVISLPVMGTFEVEGGAITAWRDYFDLNQFMTQMG